MWFSVGVQQIYLDTKKRTLLRVQAREAFKRSTAKCCIYFSSTKPSFFFFFWTVTTSFQHLKKSDETCRLMSSVEAFSFLLNQKCLFNLPAEVAQNILNLHCVVKGITTEQLEPLLFAAYVAEPWHVVNIREAGEALIFPPNASRLGLWKTESSNRTRMALQVNSAAPLSLRVKHSQIILMCSCTCWCGRLRKKAEF